MKKILTAALLVTAFTGAMAQQKTTTASVNSKNSTAVKMDKKSFEASETSASEANLNSEAFASKAKAQNGETKQQLNENSKVVANQKNSDSKTSMSGDLMSNTLVGNDTEDASIGSTLESALAVETKGTTDNTLISVKNQGNSAIENVGTAVAQVNSSVKSISTNIKTNVKVITDININPKVIITNLKIVSGIKL